MSPARGLRMLALMLVNMEAWILGVNQLAEYKLATWSMMSTTFSRR